jgi:hypothetical protein
MAGTSPRKQTTVTTKKIKITMSERSPLSIDPEQWPLIASADWFNGQLECQANDIRRIKVREHDDGRRLVYGFHTSGNGGAPIGFRGASGGFLIESVRDEKREPRDTSDGASWVFPDEDGTVRAIRRVAGIIGDDGLGDECIADLPAEELT